VQAPPREPVSAAELGRVTAAFLRAAVDGDVGALVDLIDPDVVLRSDGGGVVPAARVPVYGPDRVATLLSGLGRHYAGAQARPVRLAAGPGFVLRRNGAVLGVVGMEFAGGRVAEVNLVVSPEKLRRFADVDGDYGGPHGGDRAAGPHR